MEINHVFLDQPKTTKWNIPLSVTKNQILFLVIKGKVTYFIEDQKILLQTGDAMFIPKGVLRAAETDPSVFHSMYSLHFSHSTLPELSFTHEEGYRLIPTQHYDYLKQRLSVLYDCWVGKLSCYKVISHGILLEILGIIQRELQHSSLIPASKRNLAQSIQRHIVAHFREPLIMNELAQSLDRTPNYLSNVFKEVTGHTPVEYLHQVRIATAQELLHNTNMTVGEVADYLGYCDQSYFNYRFKKVVGQSPSHIAKNGRA